MPHIDSKMIPGRIREEKLELALKTQAFIADALGLDKGIVSVSAQEIPMENWREEMEGIPAESMYVRPAERHVRSGHNARCVFFVGAMFRASTALARAIAKRRPRLNSGRRFSACVAGPLSKDMLF